MKKVNKKDLVKKLSKNMIDSAYEVIRRQAHVNEVKPIIEANQESVLEKYQWVDEDGEIVLKPSKSYMLIGDEFTTYVSESQALHDDAGYPVENPEHCPLLIVEDELRKAKQHMIEVFEPLLDGQLSYDKVSMSLERHKKCCELYIGMSVAYVKEFGYPKS